MKRKWEEAKAKFWDFALRLLGDEEDGDFLAALAIILVTLLTAVGCVMAAGNAH